MSNQCGTPAGIKPISTAPGAYQVSESSLRLPDSFSVNFVSDTILALEYLFFDGNRQAQTRLANAPGNFTYGGSFDPAAAAAADEVNILLRRLTGGTPMILDRMRITVTTQQLFEGTITLYTGSLGGAVNAQILDNNAAVRPENNQGNILDFYFPENFVLDGFIGIGISLPITTTVQNYTASFFISGIANTYRMERPSKSVCDVLA